LPTSSGGNYDADIAALQNDIDNIYAEMENFSDELDNTLAEVDDMLENWEAKIIEEEEVETTTSDPVRWDIELSATKTGAVLLYECYPKKIDEEDTYDIDIQVTNNTASELVDVVLMLYLVPRETTAILNESDTDIYTTSTPLLRWTMDIITKSNDCTRRIECESNKFNVPANGNVVIRTEFDLAYK